MIIFVTNKTIGKKIRERRLELNMTQAQLSSITGIKKNTISNYENSISSPSEENILTLMQALKCDANYLFQYEDAFLDDDFLLRLSNDMFERMNKYNCLDENGKKAVDCILNIEYERCVPSNSNPVEKISCEDLESVKKT